MKDIAVNKSATFEYFIEEKFEAGIVLEGAEVKSLRQGKCSLSDSYCTIINGEIFIKNMHIPVYLMSGAFNTKDSKRDRKLLLNKTEIHKITGKINQKGYTLVPLKIYFNQSLIKAEVALCQGKHTYDKKHAIAEKDVKRSTERQIKEFTKY